MSESKSTETAAPAKDAKAPEAAPEAKPAAAKPAGKAVAVGKERWKNTRPGRFWYETTDPRTQAVTTRSVKGGAEFEVSAADVERMIEACSRREDSAFISGVLKRIDNRIASPEDTPEVQDEKQQTPLPEGYDPAKVLDSDELALVLKKNGMAFQTAVKKLTHPQVRQLAKIAEDTSADVTVAQANFLKEYILENVTQTKMTSTNAEINNPDGE